MHCMQYIQSHEEELSVYSHVPSTTTGEFPWVCEGRHGYHAKTIRTDPITLEKANYA